MYDISLWKKSFFFSRQTRSPPSAKKKSFCPIILSAFSLPLKKAVIPYEQKDIFLRLDVACLVFFISQLNLIHKLIIMIH